MMPAFYRNAAAPRNEKPAKCFSAAHAAPWYIARSFQPRTAVLLQACVHTLGLNFSMFCPSKHSALAALLAFLALAVSMPHAAAQTRVRVVHVFVPLADNAHQGIVPVPARLGNGRDAANNLYWGAAYGVKSFFKASSDWHLLQCRPGPQPAILERCIFRHRDPECFLVADAYDGSRIRDAVSDFIASVAAAHQESLELRADGKSLVLPIAGQADLMVYVGHDALMDFQIPRVQGGKGTRRRQFIVLACASKSFFGPYLQSAGGEPLLWTTGLMAPEAYTLKAALDGWLRDESPEAIRQRAATAYSRYQKCGLSAAQRLFAAGW